MLCFCLSAWKSQKKLQNDPPPRGRKSTQNVPKTRQESPKTVPRALHTIFQLPLCRPERPPQADLAPKTPQEESRSPFGTPRGAKFDPRGAKFNPRGFLFWTPRRRFFTSPCEPFPTQLGPYCAYYGLDTWPGGICEANKSADHRLR